MVFSQIVRSYTTLSKSLQLVTGRSRYSVISTGVNRCVLHNNSQLNVIKRMASQTNGIPASDKLDGLGKNLWVEFTELAARTKAVNLGQGFPDIPPPEVIRDALRDTATSDNPLMYQYARSAGHPRLVKALAALYRGQLGEINPLTQILTTVGAYNSLYYITQAYINPGDKVVILEPYYDCYEPMVKLAGGIPVYVAMRPSKSPSNGTTYTSADWRFDIEELSAAFDDKTKMFILNNPNNPIGKVFTVEELSMIAELCKKNNVLCVSDEVYEFLVSKPLEHVKIASLPGMFERTLTVGSAGKAFSITGFKVGWTVGPPELVKHLCTVHNMCVYTIPTPLQEAVAIAIERELGRLEGPDSYWAELLRDVGSKRFRLERMLRDAGFTPHIPEGGYFMIADASGLVASADLSGEDQSEALDYQMVKWMAKSKGLTAIPTSAFYSPQHKQLGERYIRFCFMKAEETLDKAETILKSW